VTSLSHLKRRSGGLNFRTYMDSYSCFISVLNCVSFVSARKLVSVHDLWWLHAQISVEIIEMSKFIFCDVCV